MRTTIGIVTVASAAVLGCTILGCTSNNPSVPVVASPVQAAAAGDASVAGNAVAYGALATDSVVMAPAGAPLAVDEAATAASNAAQAAAVNYLPSGCATATATGNMVSYTLKSCTGPLGASGMNGSLSIVFTSQADGLHLAITSPPLVVGTDTVILNREGVFVSNATSRTFQVTGDTGSSTGPFGSIIHQSAQGTLTWAAGSTCATYNAKENLTAGAFALVVTDTDIVRCTGQPCSQSGSAKSVDPRGGSITVTYTGTPTARFLESNLNAGALFLTCGNVT